MFAEANTPPPGRPVKERREDQSRPGCAAQDVMAARGEAPASPPMDFIEGQGAVSDELTSMRVATSNAERPLRVKLVAST